MSRLVRVSVGPVPVWVDVERLLGFSGPFQCAPCDALHNDWGLAVDVAHAADIAARLRGIGLDGRPLVVRVEPPLGRAWVREARLREARARRMVTPGFVRGAARATGEGRYSLTPEVLALALGELAKGASVVDAGCGSGGNAIGFARAGCQVIAIECDGGRLDEARHNAALYGVAERVSFVLGDACAEVVRHRADVLFVDPPWGLQYDKRRTSLEDFPLLRALFVALSEEARPRYRELWIKVPSSFEVASIEGARASAWFGAASGDVHRIKFLLLRLACKNVPG